MQDIKAELTKLGKEIEAAKKSVSQLEGRKAEIMERLQKEFGVDTMEEAEELLKEYSISIEKLEKDIETNFTKLKESFSW